jgi:6-phosphogluconolactonase (cycloisomerase 2 family)
LKKAAALLLVCAGLASLMSCAATVSSYLYAALPDGNQIDVFREDPNSGVLTVLAGSPYTAGDAVHAVIVHPSGKFLYAANSGENDISLFAISNGNLTELGQRTTAGSTPEFLAMDSGGNFLYVGNVGSNNISIFSIDATSGALTQAQGSPFGLGMTPTGMALAPSGNALYIIGAATEPGSLEVLSLSGGVPISSNPIIQVAPTGVNPGSITITPNGSYLYTANTTDDSISEFVINSDGTVKTPAQILFQASNYSAPVALQVANSGNFLFVANKTSNNVAGYTIDADGGLTILTTSPFPTNTQPSALSTDPKGQYLFVANFSNPTIESFALNTTTGDLTYVASYKIGGNPATSMAVSN